MSSRVLGKTPRSGSTAEVAINPAEVYHLAQLAALRDARKGVIAAGANTSDTHEQGEQARLLSDIDVRANQVWMSYLDALVLDKAQRAAAEMRGPPDAIELDDAAETVIIRWNDVGAENVELPADWGSTSVLAESDGTQRPFYLSTPFRPVRIEDLPEGTQQLRIHDRHHAATLALLEIIETLVRDLHAFSDGLRPAQVWQRMVYQAAYYRELVDVLRKELPDDEFLRWQKDFPGNLPLEEAHLAIAELASTTRSQGALALHAVSTAYTQRLSEWEAKRGSGSEADGVRDVTNYFQRMQEIYESAANGFGTALLAFARLSPAKYTVLPILRPLPRGLPLLAAIPN